MYSASIIANAFVEKAIEFGKPITQMQLQKMVFFAQGYHLAKYDEKLIQEDFQAWKFGPVVPRLYDIYKLNGSYPITDTLSNSWNPFEVPVTLDEKALDAIDYTWKATSHLSALQLSNWTHLQGSPWERTYKPYDMGVSIDNDLIKSYFKTFLSNDSTA